jgi:hypothetical protein
MLRDEEEDRFLHVHASEILPGGVTETENGRLKKRKRSRKPRVDLISISTLPQKRAGFESFSKMVSQNHTKASSKI